MELVTTAPGVLYRVTTTDGEVREIDSPAKLPEPGHIARIEEPVITAMVLTPAEFVGGILQLCQDKRGVQKALEYKASDRVLITYELPFNEVVMDFYDRLRRSRAAMRRWTTMSLATGSRRSSSSTSSSTASRSTPCRSSCTAIAPTTADAPSHRRCAS